MITQPGLTFMMSSTFLPAPEVAVTIMSMSAMCLSARADRNSLASGVSCRIDSFSASSLAVSGETRYTSSATRTSRRAQTEPMAPVAPTTMALNCTFSPFFGAGSSRRRSSASCAAHSAPEAL